MSHAQVLGETHEGSHKEGGLGSACAGAGGDGDSVGGGRGGGSDFGNGYDGELDGRFSASAASRTWSARHPGGALTALACDLVRLLSPSWSDEVV